MACGGQSYRQCFSDVVKAHGHKGLYNGFASGLVRTSPECQIPATHPCCPTLAMHRRLRTLSLSLQDMDTQLQPTSLSVLHCSMGA